LTDAKPAGSPRAVARARGARRRRAPGPRFDLHFPALP